MAPWSNSTIEIALGSYEEVALEYYDAVRHPTCANFREATRIGLRHRLRTGRTGNETYFEIGAGKSLLLEELIGQSLPLKKVSLIDSSPSMLKHSVHLQGNDVRCLIGDATRLDAESNCVDFLVSSLGDPYNTTLFWKEAHRILRHGGSVFYSTPSHEWATAFRIGQDQTLTAAEFKLRDGRTVFLPSFVLPVQEEIALIEGSGLHVTDVHEIPIADLHGQPLSPKLMLDRGPGASIVTCYIAVKKPR